jgi:rhodanese-related sulfurtransferase
MSNKGDAHMNLLFTLSSVLLIGAEITVASAAFAQGLPPAVTQKVQAAQKQVKTIGMEEYRKVVENPGGTLIVDVREPQEYAAGHVPGAINIPRGVIEFKIWNQVGYPANTQMDQPIVLQCQSGNRASLAAQSLADLGFTHINAVVMSLDDWQKSGHPFVK